MPAWLRVLLQVGLACAVAVWLVSLLRWLESIPEVPESLGRFGRLLTGGLLAAEIVAGACGWWIARAAPRWPGRRGLWAASCVLVAVVCWWLPAPFGLTR